MSAGLPLKMKTIFAAYLVLFFTLPNAEAAHFDFSYNANSRTLSGTLDGTLQADNNTVYVNSVLDFVTFDGSALPSMAYVNSFDARFSYSQGAPLLTLDGSFMDFVACETSDCYYFFGFGVGNRIESTFGMPVYLSSAGYATTQNEPFQQANWQIRAVPTPPTLVLLLAGGSAYLLQRRKPSNDGRRLLGGRLHGVTTGRFQESEFD
jgi:hypothetical protein